MSLPLVWFAIALYLLCAVIFIVWRVDVAYYAGLIFGGRLPPGCAVAAGVIFIALAFGFYLIFVADVFGVRSGARF